MAAMLTDAALRAAANAAQATGKGRTLTDAGRRGEGRLLAMVRPMPAGPLVEWYARQIDGKRRRLVKLGTLPAMTLASARAAFRELAPVIRERENLKAHRDKRRHARRELGTLRELLTAYTEHLEAGKRRSAPEVRRTLLEAPDAAAKVIGPDMLAADVLPQHVADWLRPIHRRGAQSMADQARRNLSAALNWAARNENDYTGDANKARRWGLTGNPAALVPVHTAARRAGTRHLSADEFRAVWYWLAAEAGRTDGRATGALRLVMATGQRVEEITRLTAGQYSPGAPSWLQWPTTKTGKPHAIPLPAQAALILDNMTPNRHGFFIPGLKYPEAPFPSRSLDYVTRRCAQALEIARFCPRDLRRTWRTLAGDAGLPPEACAMLMNHAYGSRIEAKHYNHSAQAPAKIRAMELWGEYLAKILAGRAQTSDKMTGPKKQKAPDKSEAPCI